MTEIAFFDQSPASATDIPLGQFQTARNRTSFKPWIWWSCGALIVAVVAFSPIPRAGNHPLAWLSFTMLIGAFATVLSPWASFGAATLGTVPRRILTLGYCFVAFAVFQALPISAFSDGITVQFPDIAVMTNHISIAPGAAVLAGIRIMGYLIFFSLVLFAAKNPHRAKAIGWLVFYSVAVHALFAIVSLKFLGDTGLAGEKTAFLGAATGAFINKNSFANFLGMGLILGLSLLLSELARSGAMRRVDILPGLLAFGVISTALLLSQSRMGIAATGIGAICVVLGSRTSKSIKPLVILAAFAVAIAFSPTLLQSGFFELRMSAQTRLDLYQQIFGMIQTRPLVGFGLDSFALAYEPFHAPPVTAEFVWDKGHSTYLTLWVESGVIFGSIPPLMGILAFAGLWARLRIPSRGRSLALAGFGVMVLGAIHSTVDFSLEIQANLFLLITIVGLGLSDSRRDRGTP